MNLTLLPLLRCTAGCESELDVHVSQNSGACNVSSGTLQCRECGRKYPIQEGIVRMLPGLLADNDTPPDHQNDNAVTHKLSEMRARDAQVKDYDRMWYLNLFGKVEVPLTLRHLSPAKEHLILEAGCGTGRMTRTFATQCDQLISADFSWESLRTCAQKLRSAGITNVELIQADICCLPLRSDAFDRVVSCQVLEHIPTPQCRSDAVKELTRVLKCGGRLVLSAYQHSLFTRMFGKKEGQHDGGIYFYRFARKELHALLSRTLIVEAITGAMVYHYIARCKKEHAHTHNREKVSHS